MEESGPIVGKQTLEYSNASSESSVDNVPVLTRGSNAGELPSDRAKALSENCSVVIDPARTWFKRNIECVESFTFRRRRHTRVKSDEYARKALRRKGCSTVALFQMGKMGKFHALRLHQRECLLLPSLAVHGIADQVLVAVTSLIINRRNEGPAGIVVLGEEGK